MLVAAVLVVAAAIGVFLARRPHGGTGATAAGVKRLAVLPFENQGSPEDDYFADGIADEVRGKLTSVPGLEVIARGSSTPYKKSSKTPQEIAKELDVHYLLTATVRWQKGGGNSRVQVRPELVEVRESGAPASKWQQSFDAAMTDVFQVQSDIATKVAQALGGAIGAGEEQRLSEKPTENLAAYDAFLKGEAASSGMAGTDPLSLRKALGFYEQAVALDPDFVQGWARVSMANSALYYWGLPTSTLDERSRQAAEKARIARAESARGVSGARRLRADDPGNSSAALQQYAKGQSPGTANADLLVGVALAEESLGRWDAAVDHLKQAVRLDPRSVVPMRRLAEALGALRRYPEAREVFDRVLALAPSNLPSIHGKALSFLGEGDLNAAREVGRAASAHVSPIELVAYFATYSDLVWVLDQKQRDLLLRLTPSSFDDDPATWALCLTQAYALNGDASSVRRYADDARAAYEAQLREMPDNGQQHVLLGLSLAYLGRKEEAIREGLRGVELIPLSKNAVGGPYFQTVLARIYTLVGEPEKAIDQLEPLLKVPCDLSPAFLAIDPNFEPLRANPRFQKLVARK